MRASADLLAGYYHARAQGDARVHRVGDGRRTGPRRRHALDPAGHRERAAGQHRRRLRPAPRPGGLRARHRRLSGTGLLTAGGGRWSGIALLAWSRSGSRSARRRRRWTTGSHRWSAHPRLRRLLLSSPTPCGVRAVLVILRRRRALSGAAGGSRRSWRWRRSSRSWWRGCSSGSSVGERDGELAYPSGHTTLAVVVLGLAVLVAGAAMWAVVAAVTAAVLGVLGQGVTYHYFTDTVGALLPRHRAGCCRRWAGRT